MISAPAPSAPSAPAPARDAVVLDGKVVRLDPRALLGEGGEGRVYRHGPLALKVFTSPTPARQAKLVAFPARLPPAVIGPVALCHDRVTGAVVGYAMRAVEGGVPLAQLARRPFREASAPATDVLAVLRELADVVTRLHARGLVVGDLNDGNVLLAMAPRGAGSLGSVALIDADSMQLPGHPCVVAHERFLDPRLYGVDLAQRAALSRATDAYALAVLAFASLTCLHPFGGTSPLHPTLLRRAEARVSVLSPGVKLPKAALPITILPDEALAFFVDVFEKDARTESPLLPDSVLGARFARCSCGLEHARRVCPVCTAAVLVRPTVRARGLVRASSVLRPSPGWVVAAEVHGSALLTLHDDGRGLVREDGARVPAAPGARFRLLPRATWVLGPTHAERNEGGTVTERLPIGRVIPLAEPAADVTPHGLVHVSGDQLVRSWDGTRLGQVLEDQTWVRTGARLGFAFYRAGAVTVGFVFDVTRGPLRQVDMPPLDGRLVDAHATFDAAHVLVRFVTEKRGRVRHHALLFDARGNRLASAAGAEDASPLFAGGAGLENACLAGGAVLVATPDGLALLAPSGSTPGAFETRRVFPDAKDFASPDAAMLVGPGGSVYVRTHDEIVHLGFSEAGGQP